MKLRRAPAPLRALAAIFLTAAAASPLAALPPAPKPTPTRAVPTPTPTAMPFPAPPPAASLPTTPRAQAEAAVANAISAEHISGLSLAVVENGSLAWSGGWGYADLEGYVVFAPGTVWRLGSISKSLTAVAAMQLVERGKLDLDAPIQTYCPAFPKKPQPITSRQLLGHLSGIRHYAKDENFNSTRHYDSITASLDAFKNDPLVHPPGTYTYSTYGYVVLGCVIEGASGRKFTDYLRESVTSPAGMDRTRPDDLRPIVARRARGYQVLEGGELGNAELADTSNKIPGGGLVSTAEDLARFAIALQKNLLLKPETFAQMQQPMKQSDGKDSPYFGWTIGDKAGDKTLTHTGSQQGTSTALLMVPSRGFAVALISNTESVSMGKLAREIADILLPSRPR
jgi:serine beta-lactamase-like protein LACTB, mitochondrial